MHLAKASCKSCPRVLAGGIQPDLAGYDLNGSRATREALKPTAAVFLLMRWLSACTINVLFVDKLGAVTYSETSAYIGHQRP